MKRALVILAFSVVSCFGQLPSTWVGGGAGFSNAGRGQWVSYARCKNTNCSYTTYDITVKDGTRQTATRTGVAALIRQYKIRTVDLFTFAFLNGGVATNQTSLVGSLSGGGIFAAHWKNGASVVAVVRAQKNGRSSSNVYEIGFGWTGK
jgi:hypothetical protein